MRNRTCVPGSDEQSASPVIGIILMVAITVILAAVIGGFALGFTDELNAVSGNAKVDFDESPVGLEMTVEAISTTADVRVNGETIATIDEDDTGRTVLIPTAPNDRVTVVSGDDRQSVLVDKTVDERDEIGDFISYYTFEKGSGNTVQDRSGNGNDGTAKGSYTWNDGSMSFDGTSGTEVDVGDLTVDGPDSVDEITVAIKYQINGGDGSIQNIVEHQDGSFAWYMETDGLHGDGGNYDMEFDIGFGSPPSERINTGVLPNDQTEILIGTYDGERMTLYRDGNKINSKSLDRPVELGEIRLAADSNPSIQNMDGRIYDFRLYYAAFDESEAERITETMS